MEDEIDLEKEFSIGGDLLLESRNQAKLHVSISKAYASKWKAYKLKELELAILKDQLAEDMRINPSKWNIRIKEDSNISDTAINRIIVRNLRYKLKYKEFITAKSEAKEWEGIREASTMRSHSIGRLLKIDNE